MIDNTIELTHTLFQNGLIYLNPIEPDEYLIRKTNLNDTIFIHYNNNKNNKNNKKIDYIGRVVRTFTSFLTDQVSKIDDIELLWERTGQVYKSPRLSKRNPEWVPHKEKKHLFINNLSYVSSFFEFKNNQANFTQKRCLLSTLRIQTIDEDFRYQSGYRRGEYEFVDFTSKTNYSSLSYFKIPVVNNYLKIDRFLNNKVGPLQIEETIRILIDKFPYDIYRYIVSYI